MRKTGEDEETKTKSTPESKSGYFFENSKYQSFIDEIKTKGMNTADYLETSMKNSITQQDSIIYHPKNLYTLCSTRYISSPPPLRPEHFEKFNDDTLFFIIYIQNDLQLRYHAIKELRERGWKLHNKFSTFFQLQGNPKSETDQYIEGKFKFFDFEQDWVMRTKKEFKFELAYLDDTE